MPKTAEEVKDDEARKGLRDFTCNSCGETRNLLDFYDNFHKVWLLTGGGVLVDHGEADPKR